MTEYYIAWWNLENLYDVMPWEERKRKIKNTKSLKKDIQTWTDEVLEKKLTQLAEVINEMNEGKGPDILGVCEVENVEVLIKLVAKLNPGQQLRSYEIIYHESKDPRGIDIAFIYDEPLFDFHIKNPEADEDSDERRYVFVYDVIKRSPTRDILQINFKPRGSEKPFVVIGNHWPARIPGTYDTEPYRIIAAETLSYFILRIQEELGKNTPILVMGDFNDEPGSRSLLNYALSCRNSNQVLNARTPKLLNLTWELMDEEYGTYWYDGPLFFDQILVSRGFLLQSSTFSLVEDSIQVIHPKKMWENPDGEYPKPRKFGWKADDPLGYSDHFPIAIKIKEN